MRRLLSALFALTLAACGGGGAVEPSPSVTPPTPTESPSPSASPTPTESGSPSPSMTPTPTPTASPAPAQVDVPDDGPTTYRGAFEPETVPIAKLLPPGAQPAGTWITSPPDDPVSLVAVAWNRGDDPFFQERGFEVWQRFSEGAPWRIVYAFTDAADSGVLGIRLQVGDATGDGADDVLTAEEEGGSGACATWRVVGVTPGAATELYRKQRCDTDMVIGEGKLVVTSSIYRTGDSHCCPSATRLTTFTWSGKRWVVVDKQVTENG